MTGGGPGYATYTLPLYAFLKAYTSMEFGYGAALALIFTALLLGGRLSLYVRRAGEDARRDDRPPLPARAASSQIELPIAADPRLRARRPISGWC